MELNGCAALVTGCTGGLGAANARALAAQGGKAAIFNVRRGKQVAAQISGLCKVAVASSAAVAVDFDEAHAAHDQRILVKCASISSKQAGRDLGHGTAVLSSAG